jgi:hypothetical protein
VGVELLKPSKPVWRRVLLVCGSVAVLYLIAAIVIPVQDGPYRRQHANEAVAVGILRRTNDLERRYAEAHPSEGFVCELPKLSSVAEQSDRFVTSAGHYAGYIFSITDCTASSNGKVTQYEFVAVPFEPGKSGFRAFCTNDSGTIWSDKNGSAGACMANKVLLR